MNSYARNLIGQVAERAVRQRLKREGFSVQKFNHCKSLLCPECGILTPKEPDFTPKIGYSKECKRGKKWIKLMRYRDELKKPKTSNEKNYVIKTIHYGDKTLEIRTSGETTNLDYYATKDGEEYVIEVKANTSKLTKNQKELMSYAKQLGYHVSHIRVTINVTGKIDETVEK